MFQYIGYTQCIYLTCLAYAGLNTLGSVFQILDTYLSSLSEAELIYGFVSELNKILTIIQTISFVIDVEKLKCCAVDVLSVKCPHILEFMLSD